PEYDDDEHGRPVAAVGKAIAEAASLTALAQLQSQRPIEQLPLSATRATSQQARPQRSSKLIILSHAGDVLHSPHPMQRGLSPQSSSSPKNGTAGPQLPRRDLHRTDGLFSVRSRCPGTPDVDAGEKE